VDGQLAISANTFTQSSFDPSLFYVQAQPRDGVAPEKVEAAIYAELEKLQNAPIPEKELTKAKNQMIANNYRQLQTIAGRANAIGFAEEYFGGWQHVNEEEKLINAVTSADVQRVAKKYMTANNRTVATLIPDKNAQDATAAPAATGGGK
jgi:zinc protease